MKNILFLAHRLPYPPNKGDKIRSFNLLKFLCSKGRVFLGTLVDARRDEQYIPKLATICHAMHISPISPVLRKPLSALAHFKKLPASVAYFHDRRLQGWVDTVLKKSRFDLVFCFSSTMAEYIFRTMDRGHINSSTTSLVMDFCDVDSRKWIDYARINTWPLSTFFYNEGFLLRQYEKKITLNFQHCFLASSRELDLFRQYSSARNVHVLENGVDLEFFKPGPGTDHGNNPPTIVFTGAMDYDVNIDGVCWFVEKIWPFIKHEVPDAQFYIAGSNPAERIKELGDQEDITVTGFVEDIRYYYNLADVCIAPLRIARGIQNKVLEAMAMGRPVVCTSNAFEGINAEPERDVVVTDRPENFAKRTIALLNNLEERRRMGHMARNCMELNYNWDNKLKTLEQFL